MKLEFSLQIFEKSANIKFRQAPSSGTRVVPCGRTDGRTDMKLIVASRNFAKAPKMWSYTSLPPYAFMACRRTVVTLQQYAMFAVLICSFCLSYCCCCPWLPKGELCCYCSGGTRQCSCGTSTPDGRFVRPAHLRWMGVEHGRITRIDRGCWSTRKHANVPLYSRQVSPGLLCALVTWLPTYTVALPRGGLKLVLFGECGLKQWFWRDETVISSYRIVRWKVKGMCEVVWV